MPSLKRSVKIVNVATEVSREAASTPTTWFGTREETYLALYAAGVFVLLSMTSWAAARRLVRSLRGHPTTPG